MVGSAYAVSGILVALPPRRAWTCSRPSTSLNRPTPPTLLATAQHRNHGRP